MAFIQYVSKMGILINWRFLSLTKNTSNHKVYSRDGSVGYVLSTNKFK